MALTLGGGPLASKPGGAANYDIDGPAHRLWMHDFERRVRALLGGEVVLDTRNGTLLHESNLLPQLYVPREDVRTDLLERTEHSTHCPFKGDAGYYSIRVGDRVAPNAVWEYPGEHADSLWLSGCLAVYWDAMDAWFDEDEEVHGHLRDPYHRVDVRATSQRVRVLAGTTVVADTRRAKLLTETGLPPRYYVPPEDVRPELLEPSDRHTHCPYKGRASYRGVRADDQVLPDAVWYYPEPLEEAIRVRDHLCFLADGISTEVDGEIR